MIRQDDYVIRYLNVNFTANTAPKHLFNKFWTYIDQVTGKLLYQVDGLCGFFSGDKDDDRQKPDGSSARSNDDFGVSWTVPNSDECETTKCEPTVQQVAYEVCTSIRFVMS